MKTKSQMKHKPLTTREGQLRDRMKKAIGLKYFDDEGNLRDQYLYRENVSPGFGWIAMILLSILLVTVMAIISMSKGVL